MNQSWAGGELTHDHNLDRVRSDVLVFGTLLLTAQFLVPTSLVTTLLGAVDGAGHTPLAWGSSLFGELAVLYSLAAAP